MAALCHDLGHLPFSHSAQDLLTDGWTHERITIEIILSDYLKEPFDKLKIKAEDVAKIAVGPEKYSSKDENYVFKQWEEILSEIIIGDAFGVDRIDYLLRDSLHTGVAYGKFDHYRLIDCLRILPKSKEGSEELELGIEEGGLHSAEALILARYFMYTQLYFHSIRRIYDKHLQDFLKKWLPDGKFPTQIDELLKMTDSIIINEMMSAVKNVNHSGHEPAKCIMEHKHFKLLYKRNPKDIKINPEAGRAIYEAACEKFGVFEVEHDYVPPKGSIIDFPISEDNGNIASVRKKSEILDRAIEPFIDFVFVSRDKIVEAEKWLKKNRQKIIVPKKEKE